MLTERAKEILSGAEGKMQDAITFLEEDLKTYRVGKANPNIFNGLMAFPNLVALILLSGIVARETKKFFEKLEKEKD